MTEKRHVHHQRHRARHRSQLHARRAFSSSANNRSYFLGKIIPTRVRGSNSEYDTKTFCTTHRPQRQVLGSIFLRALGMKSNEDILRTFYQVSASRCADQGTSSGTFARIVTATGTKSDPK